MTKPPRSRELNEDDMCAPLEIVTCEACDGRGFHVVGIWVHEPGCGYGHNSTDEIRCDECLGYGEFVEEAEGVVMDDGRGEK